MTAELYLWMCCGMAFVMLVGLALMTRVGTAIAGNLVCAAAIIGGAVLTILYYQIETDPLLYAGILMAAAGGFFGGHRVRMVQMPQVVALLNALGGAASALAALSALLEMEATGMFERGTAGLSMGIGALTVTGSLAAAGKLHKLLPQKPLSIPGKFVFPLLVFSVFPAGLALMLLGRLPDTTAGAMILLSGALFGWLFFIRIGGADMPVCISFLNALSGLCGALTGMAEENPFLVAAGGIITAGGLLLTQHMCKGAGYNFLTLLFGRVPVRTVETGTQNREKPAYSSNLSGTAALTEILRKSRRIAIIPGFGMVAAHAGKQLKIFYDILHKRGIDVVFGVHPMAGRLPGHMNVLLVEAGIPYKKLLTLEKINELMPNMDLAIVVGANDVVNTAARDNPRSPLSGKPIIQPDLAAHVLVCNLDTESGHDGIANPLFTNSEKVTLLLGNASDTIRALGSLLNYTKP